jgi:methionine synthase I (cobalamin-dependent)
LGRGHEAAAIVEAGARLSKEGGGPEVFVFGSVGPIAWQGVSPRDVEAAFTEKTLALCRGGVDAIVLETFMDLGEARAALDCSLATSLPVVVSLTYGWGEDGCSTPRGVTARRAAEELGGRGISALGVNCGGDFAALCRVVRNYRDVWGGPIWVKPSAGIPRWAEGAARYDRAPDEFAAAVRGLVDAGANVVGGCCGTTPGFIAAVHRELGDRLSE